MVDLADIQTKRRILFAIDSLTGGGAERVMVNIANQLEREDFSAQIALTLGSDIRQQVHPDVRVTDLTTARPLALTRPMTSPDALITDQLAALLLRPLASRDDRQAAGAIAGHRRLASHIRVLRRAMLMLGRHVRATQPDVILSFLPLTNLVCLMAKHWYRFDTPVVLSDRNYLSQELATLPWNGLHARAVRAYYPSAAHHVSVSHAAATDLTDSYAISPDSITTIYNGVDAAALNQQAQASLDIGASSEEIRLVAVGRLHRQKGFDVLISALARLTTPNWRLWLLGSGDEETALRAQAAQLGVEDRIDFIGFDANPWRWMARADLFVLSSRWEGLPNVLLEALALGLPVVACDCPSGPAEILQGGRWGQLVENDSVEALSIELDNLIANRDLRHRLAEQSVVRAKDFAMETMVDNYANLLSEVCKAS